jgi:hypothetical protein
MILDISSKESSNDQAIISGLSAELLIARRILKEHNLLETFEVEMETK